MASPGRLQRLLGRSSEKLMDVSDMKISDEDDFLSLAISIMLMFMIKFMFMFMQMEMDMDMEMDMVHNLGQSCHERNCVSGVASKRWQSVAR